VRQAWKENFANIFLAVFSVVLFLGGVELFLSVTGVYEKILSSKAFQKFENIPIECQVHNGAFLLDDLLFWKIGPRHGDVNKQGFRNKNIFLIPKPDSTYRIICLGDSVPFGFNCETTKTSETYPELLKGFLKKKSNLDIEVINAGVPGYSSLQGLRYLKRDLLQFEPDMVIVHFGPDDGATAIYFSDKEQVLSPKWFVDTQNFLCRSKTYTFLNAVIFYFKSQWRHSSSSEPRVDEKDYKKNLSDIARLGEEFGFETIFLPSLQYAKETGITQHYDLPEHVVSVKDLGRFRGKEEDSVSLFIDNCHLTPKGHRLLAEDIADFLVENSLLTKSQYS